MSDARDWAAMVLVGAGFIASWTWVFIHPSVQGYGICVGAVGTFGAIFHWICMTDDKSEDKRNDKGN